MLQLGNINLKQKLLCSSMNATIWSTCHICQIYFGYFPCMSDGLYMCIIVKVNFIWRQTYQVISLCNIHASSKSIISIHHAYMYMTAAKIWM